MNEVDAFGFNKGRAFESEPLDGVGFGIRKGVPLEEEVFESGRLAWLGCQGDEEAEFGYGEYRSMGEYMKVQQDASVPAVDIFCLSSDELGGSIVLVMSYLLISQHPCIYMLASPLSWTV